MGHNLQDLARRERQILEIVYSLGRATASEVHQQLADPPSYSTVRKVLSILEEKGHIRHIEQGRRYVYLPTTPKRKVQSSALQQLMDSLFENSAESVVSTLMDISARRMSDDDLERLARIIDRHRKERQ
jgi:predicted transcriptional regulator